MKRPPFADYSDNQLQNRGAITNRRFRLTHAAVSGIALSLAAPQAFAACTQSGAVITCTGINDGQLVQQDNVTIVIDSMATVEYVSNTAALGWSVFGDGNGIQIQNNGTVRNNQPGRAPLHIVSASGGLEIINNGILESTGTSVSSGMFGRSTVNGAITLSNTQNGSISATNVGIEARTGYGGPGGSITVTNAGSINVVDNMSFTGIESGIYAYLSNTGVIDISNTGMITGQSPGVNGVEALLVGGMLTFDNAGGIDVAGVGAVGAFLEYADATLQVSNSGDISSTEIGLLARSSVSSTNDASVFNDGEITTTYDDAVLFLLSGGRTVNFENHGLIEVVGAASQGAGVFIQNSSSSTAAATNFVNTGSILSDRSDGVFISTYGTVNLTNSGTLETIDTRGGRYGLETRNSTDMVTNSGEITGGVLLHDGDDTFIMEGGAAVLNGAISGGNGTDTLVFLNAPGQQFNSNIISFENIDVDGGDVRFNAAAGFSGVLNILDGEATFLNTQANMSSVNLSATGRFILAGDGSTSTAAAFVFDNNVTGGGAIVFDSIGDTIDVTMTTPVSLSGSDSTVSAEAGEIRGNFSTLGAANFHVGGDGRIVIDNVSGSGATSVNFLGDQGGIIAISGGSLELNGDNAGLAGTLELRDIELTGGLSALNVGSISGDSDSVIIVNEVNDGEWSADVNSAGAVNITGGAAIAFTGMMDSASFDIQAGRLFINTANFVAPVSIGSNGVLGGAGTVTGNIDVDGTVTPGNSIGTLSVVGDVVFDAGSTFEVEFDANAIDLLDVTGSATINAGANLVFIPLTSGAASGGTFLQASGGVTGTFDNVSVQGGGNISVAYMTNSAEIGAQLGSGGGSGGGGGPVILSARPDHLSAEASMMSAFAFDVTDMVAGQMVRHVPDGRRRVWGGYVGGFADIDQSGAVEATNLDHNGFVGGVDYPLSDRLSLGVAFGWTNGTAEIDRAASKVSAESFFMLATARGAVGGVNLTGGLVYGDHDLDTDRHVVFNNMGETLQRDAGASSLGLFLKGRAPVGSFGGSELALTGGIDLWRGAIDEAGDASSNMLALTVDKTVISGGRFEGGLDLQRDIAFGGVPGVVYAAGGVRYTTAFDDRDFSAAFNNGAGPAVVLDGDEGSLFQAVLGAGMELNLTDALRFYADYDFAGSGEAKDHAIATGLRLAF